MTKIEAIKNLFNQKPPPSSIDWDQVYDVVMPQVYNYFRYRFFNNDVAEELTAITLSRAWQGRNRYKKDQAKFSTWVIGIARYVAIDEFRKKTSDEVEIDRFEQTADDSHVENKVHYRQSLAELQSHLSKLTAEDQELIGLKYGAGLTNRAIAQLVGLSESNVGTKLHRIVKQLRAQMGIKL